MLEDLVLFFERHGIPYLIMGGVAVRLWGIPRPTYDLDFTLAVEPENIPGLCENLRKEGFSVSEAHERGFTDRLAGMRNFGVVRYIEGKDVRVDMFLVTTTYQKEAFQRRVRMKANGSEAWFISPEDLILHKLIAGRDRDLADVTDILCVSPEVDKNYLRKWAPVLGVSENLEKKLADMLS
ncbi:MAG: hypothetical protein HYU36_22060 [Planctomycetes bacterium]|nr:hypothetical protein [Planctomycetota bacterium]